MTRCARNEQAAPRQISYGDAVQRLSLFARDVMGKSAEPAYGDNFRKDPSVVEVSGVAEKLKFFYQFDGVGAGQCEVDIGPKMAVVGNEVNVTLQEFKIVTP